MLSKITVGGVPLPIDEYKDGAIGVQITPDVLQAINTARHKVLSNGMDVIVSAFLKDAQGVLALIYLLDYLEDIPNLKVVLNIPFFPNARQDRETTNGVTLKTLSLKSLTKILNRYNCVSNVLVSDAHSDVTTALVDKCRNMPQSEIMYRIVNRFDLEFDVLVSPDLGAVKKAKEVAKRLQKPLAIAVKDRNPITNELTDSKILEASVKGKRVLVIDDILDGGRTFINLAKILKEEGASEVYLAVTHGIFSYGVEPLVEVGIDRIFTYYSWLQLENNPDSFVKTVETF